MLGSYTRFPFSGFDPVLEPSLPPVTTTRVPGVGKTVSVSGKSRLYTKSVEKGRGIPERSYLIRSIRWKALGSERYQEGDKLTVHIAGARSLLETQIAQIHRRSLASSHNLLPPIGSPRLLRLVG